VLDARVVARVDSRGRVDAPGDAWSLDWWIGAEDRWHFASREAAVRQRLVDATPVVETVMRVPGGDAVARVYACREGEADAAVVEVENASRAPMVVAFVVVPNARRIRRIDLGDTTVSVDRRAALWLPRPPPRVAVGADTESAVVDGRAVEQWPGPGAERAAFLYPLAHGAIIRVAQPLAPPRRLARAKPSRPSSLPTAAQVARGWRAHTVSGPQFEVPDARLADAVSATRARALMSGAAPAEVVEPSYAAVEALLDAASPVVTWPEPDAGRRLLALVRAILVREVDGGLALCTDVPAAWAGQPIEVREAPTGFGTLSYAVRWHGRRPALLWELEGDAPVRLTAPGLDAAWFSDEPRGDALLRAFAAAVPAAGDSFA
jgi:hypothetical protein